MNFQNKIFFYLHILRNVREREIERERERESPQWH